MDHFPSSSYHLSIATAVLPTSTDWYLRAVSLPQAKLHPQFLYLRLFRLPEAHEGLHPPHARRARDAGTGAAGYVSEWAGV